MSFSRLIPQSFSRSSAKYLFQSKKSAIIEILVLIGNKRDILCAFYCNPANFSYIFYFNHAISSFLILNALYDWRFLPTIIVSVYFWLQSHDSHSSHLWTLFCFSLVIFPSKVLQLRYVFLSHRTQLEGYCQVRLICSIVSYPITLISI